MTKVNYFFQGQLRVWTGSLPAINAMQLAERNAVLEALKKSRSAAFAAFYCQKHIVDMKQSETDQLRVANEALKQRIEQLRTLRVNKEIPKHVMEGCLSNMGISAKCKPDGSVDFECPICKEDLCDLGNICMTSTCGHVFHHTCMENYLVHGGANADKCPTCRGHMLTDKIYILDDAARAQAQHIIDLTEKEPRIIVRAIPPRARSKRIAEASSSSSKRKKTN